MVKSLTLIIAAIFTFLNIGCSKAGDSCSYNTAVKFEQGKILSYPDFTAEYTGIRTVTKDLPNGNKITFRYHDFKINSAAEQKTVSWSSGTGDIAPVRFETAGKKFELELSYSEELKTKLSENELVIVKK